MTKAENHSRLRLHPLYTATCRQSPVQCLWGTQPQVSPPPLSADLYETELQLYCTIQLKDKKLPQNLFAIPPTTMSWKGIKRAAVRAPHLMMGNKSNDAIFESLEKEFTSAISAVDKIITESKNFRDSWTRLLTHQLEMTTVWSSIYSSIPSEHTNGRSYYETPQSTLQSIDSCTAVLNEVKETLLPILNSLDGKVIQPSMDMKKALEAISKMVKKRHHKKMDYDRFTASVEKLRNKKDKTEKDQAMLLKMENELEVATQEFQMHDERLKEMIPSIMETISAFFAPMLTTVYSVQSDLYQHLYASVYEYATSQGLIDIDNVVEEFSALYEQIRQRAETEIKSIRDGKAARIPMGETGAKPGIFARKSSSSMMPSLNRTSSNKPTSTPPPSYSPQLDTRKSSSSLHKSPPLHPSTASPMLSPNPGGRQNSYEITSNGRTPSSSINALEAKKKKPPPPPPPKPSLSPKPEFVIAKYDFAGENQGDLAFKVGDRIKIIKKTDSLEDWWEGELNGMRGMFPRNYCD